MKKFLLLALLLLMTSCEFGTESKKEVPNVPPKDTTKVIAHRSVVVNDTNISKTHTLNISGKISEKNNSGNTIGGFSSAVVCLESSKKCVKPNSTGLYSFAAPKTSSLYGARSLAQSDTTTTPEGIVPSILPDTVVKIDSNVVYDTIIKNDTIYQIQMIHISRNVFVDNDTARNDSVIVYSNSRILYEIPVTSWKYILPEKYVVQRNISGTIVKNGFEIETKNVEAIYWSVDSIALRIPLELSNDKLAYSGFVYQPYDDSSFITGNKNKNLVVRIVDVNDSVFGISNVVTFSERSGDLSVFLNPIIPGNILRYPRPNAFRVISNGQNVVKILQDTLVKIPSSIWCDFDSFMVRPQFNKIDQNDTDGNVWSKNYKVDTAKLSTFKYSGIDSVSFQFNSEISGNVNFNMMPDTFNYTTGKRSLALVIGNNRFDFPLLYSNIIIRTQQSSTVSILQYTIGTLRMSNVKVLVHFK